MHVSKPDVTELSADGVRYEPVAGDVFEVPAELGGWLIRVHGWAPAEAPAQPSETPKRKPASKK